MRVLLTAPAALLAALAALPAAAPAHAQDAKVREIEVFGSDPCPRSTDSQVFVCRRLGEKDRYRIPERLRQGGTLQQRTAWAARVKSLEVHGINGINQCSPVGPGGYTGCSQRLIDQARRDRRTGIDQ